LPLRIVLNDPHEAGNFLEDGCYLVILHSGLPWIPFPDMVKKNPIICLQHQRGDLAKPRPKRPGLGRSRAAAYKP
jgi:hypothetical protein